jgi:hypothetical protein
VESLAEGLAHTYRAKAVGAEYDDLVQEGLIAVWQTILRGIRVSPGVVEGRMRNYIRRQGRQTGADSDFDILPLEGVEEFVVS